MLSCIIASGVIRQYRVRAQGDSGFDETYTTSSTLQLVAGLQCCSDYRFTVSAFTIAYGPAASEVTFRTNPDLSGKNFPLTCARIAATTTAWFETLLPNLLIQIQSQ